MITFMNFINSSYTEVVIYARRGQMGLEKDSMTMNEEYRGGERTTLNFHIAHASLLVFIIFIISFHGN